MKPEDKVTQLMEQYIEGDWEDLFPAIVLLLKEQDRDTRHACAEEILYNLEVGFGDHDWDNAVRSEAHNLIMNCRGGLK